MDWIKSIGTIVYDPYPLSYKKRNNRDKFEPWWVLLKCDVDIIRYNNYWLKKKGIDIHTHSLFGSHVTIVKGPKEPPNKNNWNFRNREKIEFEYGNFILDNGSHWWVLARCPAFGEIREKLGLSPKPDMNFHLTIGRSKEKY